MPDLPLVVAERSGACPPIRALTLPHDLSDLSAVRGVALVAQERRPRLQHVLRGRPVRVVADSAVLAHRLVFARTGRASPCGTCSRCRSRVLHQQLGTRGAVRVVAVGADHLAFGDRVVRGLLACARCALWHVKQTSGCVRLSRTLSCGVWTWWQFVHATSPLVHAAGPVDALSRLVAVQALAVHLVRVRLVLAAEEDIGLRRGRRRRVLFDVGFALAVAARAGRRACIGLRAVRGLADREDRVVVALVVAARALRIAAQARGPCAWWIRRADRRRWPEPRRATGQVPRPPRARGGTA